MVSRATYFDSGLLAGRASPLSKPAMLLCHSYYQQRGGEDHSFEDEVALLRARGHTVSTFTVHNDEIEHMSRMSAAAKTIWNHDIHRRIREEIELKRPDIMHCTNSFPLLSPAIHHAAKAAGVAVVQSLRNYRLICPGGTLHRDGVVCEDCVGRTIPWPAAVHGCYRDNRLASAVVAAANGLHNTLGTWNRNVDMFLCPSRFTRDKYIAAGIPSDRIRAVQNIVDPDPGPGAGSGDYAVFVGRLSAEKDLPTLIEAWRHLGNDLRLKIVGDGPAADLVRSATHSLDIEWLGRQPKEEVLSIIGEARVLIMPSSWYETFGRVIVEAFAKGTPAIVSNLGAMAELVENGKTGYRFIPGNASDLVAKIRLLLSDSGRLQRMRMQARSEYEENYTAEHKYELLLDLYREAMARTEQEQSA